MLNNNMKLVSDLNSQIDDCLKKSRFFIDHERMPTPQKPSENPNQQVELSDPINQKPDEMKLLNIIQVNQLEPSLEMEKPQPILYESIANLTENEENHLSLLELDKLLTDRLIQLNPDNKYIFETHNSSPDKPDPPNFRNLPHLNTIIEENSVIASEMETIPKTNSQSVLLPDGDSSESFHNTYNTNYDKENNEPQADDIDKVFVYSDLIGNNTIKGPANDSESFRKTSLASFQPNSIDMKSHDEQKSHNSLDTLDLSNGKKEELSEKEEQCFLQYENDEKLILKLNNFLSNVIKVENELLTRRVSMKSNTLLVDSKKAIPVVKFDIKERRKPHKPNCFANKENNADGKNSFFQNKIEQSRTLVKALSSKVYEINSKMKVKIKRNDLSLVSTKSLTTQLEDKHEPDQFLYKYQHLFRDEPVLAKDKNCLNAREKPEPKSSIVPTKNHLNTVGETRSQRKNCFSSEVDTWNKYVRKEKIIEKKKNDARQKKTDRKSLNGNKELTQIEDIYSLFCSNKSYVI